MLSTSYEAFYAMDNLRHRSNLTFAQMAQLMDWDADQYRVTQRKVMTGVVGGLNGVTDLKVRYGISMLLHGLMSDFLPVVKGNSLGLRIDQRRIIEELIASFKSINDKRISTNDPIGFIEAFNEERDQLIATATLCNHASQFAAF